MLKQKNEQNRSAKPWLKTLKTVALLGLMFLSSGCALDGFQSTVYGNGPVARMQAETFWITVVVSAVIFAVVGSILAYSIMKFRVDGELDKDAPLPEQSHGDPLTELLVVFISVALVGIIAVPSINVVFKAGTLPEDSNPLVVNVTGYQWWWRFEYPELGVVTANEFAIPAGRPVKFNLESGDVIHSFWIPRLGGKMDVVPGQDNWLWLQADEEIARGKMIPGVVKNDNDGREDAESASLSTGLLYGHCTEYCGDSHAFMRMRALVLTESDFMAWVDGQKEPAPQPITDSEKLGKELFGQNCATCHTQNHDTAHPQPQYPDLTHFGSRSSVGAGIMPNTHANIKEWIGDIEHIKHGNKMYEEGKLRGIDFEFTEQELNALADYLLSLK